MNSTQKRNGIAGAGNWIVDNVKVIDRLPARGMLGNILSETRGTGGAAFNTLVDLAKMGTPFPLYGIGVIGDDSPGEFIRRTCCDLGIDMAGLITLENEATAYTDVMTEAGTTDRSFYHRRGANARFGIEHVPVGQLTCRMFHLGYLLLLDGMDQPGLGLPVEMFDGRRPFGRQVLIELGPEGDRQQLEPATDPQDGQIVSQGRPG